MTIKEQLRNFVVVLLFTLSHSLTAQHSTFSKADVLEDYDYLYHTLIESHYDVYAFTNPEEFEQAYLKGRASITSDSLDLLEATNLFQRLGAAVKNGHTGIEFPFASYMAYATNGGSLFPLEIAFENNRPLIRKNWSTNDQIMVGDELLAINGQPMDQILRTIYAQVNGERTYFKQVKIETYSFPRYYWQLFGEHAQFEVTVLQQGEKRGYTLLAIDLIEEYESKRDEVLNSQMNFEFLGNNAYLNPGNLSGDVEIFQRFIDSAFNAIKKHKSDNLIIDLRNNKGGGEEFSNYLVAYIADRPFTWNGGFNLKTSRVLKEHVRKHYDTTAAYWKQVLDHQDGTIYPYAFEPLQPRPAEERFNGEVFVLVNRQSHSQSTVAAAQVQDYGFGTIVGEETGEYASLFASLFSFDLPRTGINIHVSKGHITRVNGSTAEEGVIPDILIKDYLVDEEDEILSGLLQRLAFSSGSGE